MQHREVAYYERAEKERNALAQVSDMQGRLVYVARELEGERARAKAKEDE